jgi:hypothetical protein
VGSNAASLFFQPQSSGVSKSLAAASSFARVFLSFR